MSHNRKLPLFLFFLLASINCGAPGEDGGAGEGSESLSDSEELETSEQALSRPANNLEYFLRHPNLDLGVAASRADGAYLVVRENYDAQSRWTYSNSQIRLAGSDLCVQHQGLHRAVRLADCDRGGTRWDTGADGRIRWNGGNDQCLTAQGEDQSVIVAPCTNANNRRWDWATPPRPAQRLYAIIGSYSCGSSFGLAAPTCSYVGQTGRVGNSRCYIVPPSSIHPRGILGYRSASYRCYAAPN